MDMSGGCFLGYDVDGAHSLSDDGSVPEEAWGAAGRRGTTLYVVHGSIQRANLVVGDYGHGA